MTRVVTGAVIRHLDRGALSTLFLVAVAAVTLASPHAPAAFGHGIGMDTIPSIIAGAMDVSVSVEIPSYQDTWADERQVTITATDRQTGEGAPNVTYLIGLYHGGQGIFNEYFFARDGHLSMNIKSGNGAVEIDGQQEPLLGAWYGTPEQPLEITGPVFGSAGLYTFEIEIKSIGEPAREVEGSKVHVADVSIVGESRFVQKDGADRDVEFGTRSYFDSIDSFVYDPAAGTVTFEMYFDWREGRISHVPVVHEEVRFPKGFAEFLAPSYSGWVNGVKLFKSSVVVDDYTEEDGRIVHFVLLNDQIRHIKNQLRQLDGPVGERMVFTLKTSESVQFPVSSWTRDESFQVDLSWDPLEIVPDQRTRFVFTIRDGATAEPMRNSAFDFVILQSGREIHRQSGNAQVGGHFVDYAFAEDQTGPTVIRFENIRGTGKATEFGIVVVPEFGLVTSMILAAGVTSAVLLAGRYRAARP